MDQFIRKASLIVMRPEDKGNNPSAYVPSKTLDLSEFQFRFKTANQDEEGPSNCSVRIYGLAQQTVDEITKYGFSRIILQAGYEGSFGVIFDGTIKQFRTGKENSINPYLDLLAADGDLGYNYAVTSAAIAANSTGAQRKAAIVQDFSKYGITLGADLSQTGGTLPRGKVLFGMSRILFRNEAETTGSTWSIQNGKIQVLPLDGYLPGQAVQLSALTGLIGIPEQTQDGIRCRCLINPRIVVGSRIQIDNKTINKTLQQSPSVAPVPFNQWTGFQQLASVAADGFYRVYVCEYEGDTRGSAWWCDIIALAIDNTSGKVTNG